MTHTLHRQGTEENLANDFPMHFKFARGFNSDPYPTEKLQSFFDITHGHKDIVNSGDLKIGNQYVIDLERLRTNIYTPCAVFTDEDTVTEVVRAVKEAQLDLSLTLSGLTTKLFACCDKAGARPYAIEHSLGIEGDLSKLPPQEMLELTTMCGHAMVAKGLISLIIRKIKRGEMTPEEGGIELAKPCQCGAFNPVRAAALLEEACVLHCVIEH